MTRLARLAIRLYPRSWRERYGEEFEALLDDIPSSVWTTFDVLKGALRTHLSASGRIRAVAMAAILGSMVGLVASFLLEKNYASDISIRVSHASTQRAGDYVEKVLNTALDNASLETIVETFGVPGTSHGNLSPTTAELTKAITVTPREAPNGESRLVIRCVAHDPKLARQIDEQLIAKIMDQGVQTALTMKSPPAVTFKLDRGATLVRTGPLHIWIFSLGGTVLGFVLALFPSVSNRRLA